MKKVLMYTYEFLYTVGLSLIVDIFWAIENVLIIEVQIKLLLTVTVSCYEGQRVSMCMYICRGFHCLLECTYTTACLVDVCFWTRFLS